jgi:hypothetical protein
VEIAGDMRRHKRTRGPRNPKKVDLTKARLRAPRVDELEPLESESSESEPSESGP